MKRNCLKLAHSNSANEPFDKFKDQFSPKGIELTSRSVNARHFVAKTLFLILLVLVCGYSIVTLRYPVKLLPILCMGLLIAHATELVHQCLHRIATGKAMVDDALGRLLGMPSGTSYWYYKWFHLWHHRYNGTDKDKESFGYIYQLMERPSFAHRILGFVRHLSMASHYWSIVTRIGLAVVGRLQMKVRKDAPEMNPNTARRIETDYRIMAIVLILSVSFSLIFHSYLIVELWLLPLLISWGPTHALIELPEHWGCDRPSSDVFTNTRSINASRLARWFTNNNCNHVGHHCDMSVPMENLPAFEEQLSARRTFKFYEQSYWAFYLNFFKHLRRPTSSIVQRSKKYARKGSK